MRILITGGQGQLGRALQGALASHDVTALGRSDLDVTLAASVDDAVRSARPDAVVHCAAMTDTTRCEREPELAMRTNAGGTANVASACRHLTARLVAISTNEVFEGKARDAYSERDATNPVNAYGASKLEGERRALTWRRTLIVRTSWLYGTGGDNFVSKVRDAARAGRALRFVTDEIASPTRCDDLADAIRRLIEQDAPPGIYHLANEGEASRYDWAREILRLAGMGDAQAEPVTTAELRASGYDGPRKPPYTTLANTRARALGIALRDWREALAEHMSAERATADA